MGLAAATLVAVPQADSAALAGSISPALSAEPHVPAAEVVPSTEPAPAATRQEDAVHTDPAPGPDAPSRSTPPASGTGRASALAAGGIPSVALEAYVRAAAASPTSCHISWPLVAAIGRVESNHGRFAGAVLHADGRSTPPIIGIVLDGVGTALIQDTDGGRLDGDPVYDRAVGPMQFIPSTWKAYAGDGDGDGRRDPFDIADAAAATAKYLCAAGGDLSSVAGQTRAVLAYNHSDSYVATVLTLAARYAGTPPPPLLPTPPAEPVPTVPPANPAPPPAIDVGLSPAAGAAPAADTSTPSTGTGSAARSGTPASSAPGLTDPPSLTAPPASTTAPTGAPVSSAPVSSAPVSSAPVSSAPV
ncbi:MAG: hypothetical protein JWR66_3891, partial [Modestobacter sp.]|nr:hypothetical protein [Modestobacter sp.]